MRKLDEAHDYVLQGTHSPKPLRSSSSAATSSHARLRNAVVQKSTSAASSLHLPCDVGLASVDASGVEETSSLIINSREFGNSAGVSPRATEDLGP